MKMKFNKKVAAILIAFGITFLVVQGAMALPYFEAGTPLNNSAPTSMKETYYGGAKAIYFTNQEITGPSGDSLVSRNQSIGGIYTLSSAGGSIYNLTQVTTPAAIGDYGTNTLRAQNPAGTTSYFDAVATALQINFNTDTISWSGVTLANTINNSIGSTALTDLAASSTYAFTSFTFEHLGTESTWLSGTTGSYNARYYSKLEGFAAAPEPAEWVLMFIGLGMLGFYLQRRGYLNFDLSPQSVA